MSACLTTFKFYRVHLKKLISILEQKGNKIKDCTKPNLKGFWSRAPIKKTTNIHLFVCEPDSLEAVVYLFIYLFILHLFVFIYFFIYFVFIYFVFRFGDIITSIIGGVTFGSIAFFTTSSIQYSLYENCFISHSIATKSKKPSRKTHKLLPLSSLSSTVAC